MTSVLYDGACPLCAREIAMYRRQPGAGAIRWLDVSQIPEAEIPLGLSRQDVLARFHVIRRDGSAAVGAAGFVELWKAFPRLRLVGRLASLPPVLFFLELFAPPQLSFLRSTPARAEAIISVSARQLTSPSARRTSGRSYCSTSLRVPRALRFVARCDKSAALQHPSPIRPLPGRW